jgi:diguanylate cyclase
MQSANALGGGKRRERPAEEGQRFARRMYLPRVLGLGVGAACVGGGLWQTDAPLWAWLLLAANAFAWPHVAYRLARRSANPYRAELRNLTIDSALGGAWIAAIGFNLVPSAVLVGMLAMDKAAVGGMRFLARCLNAQIVSAAAVALLTGFETHLESDLVAVLASLPLLLAYPVTVGCTAYRFARRIRQENEGLS